MSKFNSIFESILNGLAKGKTIEDIATKHKTTVEELNKELQKGIKVEREHTGKEDLAKEIAMDHLFEDPKYYTKLSSVEAQKN